MLINRRDWVVSVVLMGLIILYFSKVFFGAFLSVDKAAHLW